MYRTHYSNI